MRAHFLEKASIYLKKLQALYRRNPLKEADNLALCQEQGCPSLAWLRDCSSQAAYEAFEENALN